MKNKKGFTLIELTMALLIAGTFVVIIMSLFTGIKGADMRMSNKRLLLGEASDLIDKIHDAALDYTIDYEEYFNRRVLGFGPGNTGFSTYGNEGERYYCSGTVQAGSHCSHIKIFDAYLYYACEWDTTDTEYGCFGYYKNLAPNVGLTRAQKYGEYTFQHRKLQDVLDLNSKDNISSNMRQGPIAIEPNIGLDYLYLINPDGTERYYFRRIYATGTDLNHDGEISGKNEELYKVQMLRLHGFDAGSGHNFTAWGAYDGFIDTWACDFSQGYSCNGLQVTGSYKLPLSSDDGRVDITSDKVTISDMKIDIYPNKDPYLVGNETGLVYDPYAKISFTVNIYGKQSDDEITLTTTLSFKNSYTRFAPIEYVGYIPDEAY